MQLDWICLGLVAFMVSWGWLKGGLLQLARLVSLALAAGATVWAEPIVTDLVRAQFGERLPHPSLVAMGLTFGVVFLALHLTVGGYIKTLIHESDGVSDLDRILGAVLGLAKATLMIVLGLLLFSQIKDTVFRHKPELASVYQESRMVTLVLNTSFKDWLIPSQLKDTLRLDQAMKDPRWKEKLQQAEELKGLFQNPVFERLRADESAVSMLRDQDVMGLLQNPTFQDTLRDPQLMELFKDRDIGKLLETMKHQHPELPTLPDDPF